MPYSHFYNIIEKDISDFLQQKKGIHTELYQAIEYAVLSGGKRVRPMLLFLSAEANGVSIDLVRPLALAVEVIHSYSLIHDDLPAMDNSDIRRGKPTVHKIFSEGMAVLAGDALLNFAMEILLGAVAEYPSLSLAAQQLAQKAGVLGMIGGQSIDITLEQGKDIGQLENMSRLKTGAIIEWALSAPCLIPKRQECFVDFQKVGGNVGLIFQIADDIIDIGGECAVTFASVYGLDWCKAKKQKLEQECLTILQKYNQKTANLSAFIQKLTNRSM